MSQTSRLPFFDEISTFLLAFALKKAEGPTTPALVRTIEATGLWALSCALEERESRFLIEGGGM
jgi:hypothetical protein